MKKKAAIEIGKTYSVDHSRKGKFSLKVTGIDDEWITGTIVEGHAKAMMYYNARATGEEITVRESFAKWELQP